MLKCKETPIHYWVLDGKQPREKKKKRLKERRKEKEERGG